MHIKSDICMRVLFFEVCIYRVQRKACVLVSLSTNKTLIQHTPHPHLQLQCTCTSFSLFFPPSLPPFIPLNSFLPTTVYSTLKQVLASVGRGSEWQSTSAHWRAISESSVRTNPSEGWFEIAFITVCYAICMLWCSSALLYNGPSYSSSLLGYALL